MFVKEKTRQEIEMRLKVMGDYVKMDYLNSCLKGGLDFETKKFVMIILAGIYEGRGMYFEAGKLFRAGADITSTYEGQIADLLKSSELFIRGGKFDESEISEKKALVIANDKQKDKIKKDITEFYKTQAKAYLNKEKRKHALDTYEKILKRDLEFNEKRALQEKVLELYGRLGKIREYGVLKRSLD